MENTQSISRENLKTIFKTEGICGGWKVKIADLFVEQETRDIIVSNELINQAYNEADTDQKKLIEKYFKIVKEEDICNKLDGTLESVYKLLNIKESDFLPYQKHILSDFEEKMNNIARLEKVGEAYNQDWKIKFDGIQVHHYPWFNLWSGGWMVTGYSSDDFSFCYSVVVYYKSSKIALDAGNKYFWLYKKINNLV